MCCISMMMRRRYVLMKTDARIVLTVKERECVIVAGVWVVVMKIACIFSTRTICVPIALPFMEDRLRVVIRVKSSDFIRGAGFG